MRVGVKVAVKVNVGVRVWVLVGDGVEVGVAVAGAVNVADGASVTVAVGLLVEVAEPPPVFGMMNSSGPTRIGFKYRLMTIGRTNPMMPATRMTIYNK